MNGLEILKELEAKESTSESDGKKMQMILNRIGFNKAIVTCGVVYLDGKGTLNNPPTSIQSMAKMILTEMRNYQLI